MRTDYLYEFIRLSEIGNFQTAADVLFISQSSLSKHIQSIENELGFALVGHNKNKFSLTPEGMEFLPYATKICDLRTEYTELFKNRGNTKVLDVGTCHFTAIEDELFTNAILKFSTLFPSVLIRTPPILATDNISELLTDSEHSRNSCIIYKMLSSVTPPITSNLVKTETLYRWPVSVLTRKDHPFAGQKVTLEDIASEQLISLAYPTFANSLAVKAFRSAGVIPIFSNTLNSIASIFEFVANGKGLFLVTEPIRVENIPDSLCITEVAPRIISETVVAYNSCFNREFERGFIECLLDEFTGKL